MEYIRGIETCDADTPIRDILERKFLIKPRQVSSGGSRFGSGSSLEPTPGLPF